MDPEWPRFAPIHFPDWIACDYYPAAAFLFAVFNFLLAIYFARRMTDPDIRRSGAALLVANGIIGVLLGLSNLYPRILTIFLSQHHLLFVQNLNKCGSQIIKLVFDIMHWVMAGIVVSDICALVLLSRHHKDMGAPLPKTSGVKPGIFQRKVIN